ncbi:hypothetical protein [Paenibacillus sp. FSL K6-2524]|uniref:hypothetical protein n=1 Tax=Paenibacillus sp. FSL K6-2524 TaxID=2954516 RepID=UPI0030F6FCA0
MAKSLHGLPPARRKGCRCSVIFYALNSTESQQASNERIARPVRINGDITPADSQTY